MVLGMEIIIGPTFVLIRGNGRIIALHVIKLLMTVVASGGISRGRRTKGGRNC